MIETRYGKQSSLARPGEIFDYGGPCFDWYLIMGHPIRGLFAVLEDDAPGRPESSQVDRKYPGDSETAILGSWNRNQITGN